MDLNQRPRGYEPRELPSCSIPQSQKTLKNTNYAKIVLLNPIKARNSMDLTNPKRSGDVSDRKLAIILRTIVPDGIRSIKEEHLPSIIEQAFNAAEDMAAWLIENKEEWKNEILDAFRVFIWSNQYYRLNNLYYIKVKETDSFGKIKKDMHGHENELKMKFRMNAVQEELYANMHNRMVILKARQFGITTFFQILIEDYILFTMNIACGVVAQTRDDASTIFNDKIKYAYENLPLEIQLARPAKKSDANQLVLEFIGTEGYNTSRVKVSNSLRSGTYQIVHISELAKICKERPDKATEIKTGTFPTVPQSGCLAIESTAEGNTGLFKEICDEAQESMKKCKRDNRKLHPKEWRFFFFPWWRHEDYQTDARGIEISPYVKDYFRNLMADDYIKENLEEPFSAEQIAWYQLEQATQGDKMKQEFPSTPREAFEQAIEGTYFEKEMIACDKFGRIGIYKYDMNLPVYTAWDIGFGDYTCIVFFQVENMEIRIIDYFEDCNQGMVFYLRHLRGLPYDGNYGAHYAPHDMEQHDWSTGVTKRVSAAQQGVEFVTIPRCKDKHDEHEEARRRFPFIHFNAPKTEKLRTHVSMYRRKWDAQLGVWKDKPLHDEHSHGADAFLIMCRAIDWIKSGGYGISHVQEVAGQVSHEKYLW